MQSSFLNPCSSYISPKAKTQPSKISGKGTFAISPIKKDEIICIFGGRILSTTEWKKLPEDARENSIEIHDDFVLAPFNKNDVGDGDYINHSCDPSAGIVGQIFLVAMRDIKKGEEITFDYAMCVAGNGIVEGGVYKMECFCGAKNCRKLITGEDWKNKKLQKKYKGYFSTYIQYKIEREINNL